MTDDLDWPKGYPTCPYGITKSIKMELNQEEYCFSLTVRKCWETALCITCFVYSFVITVITLPSFLSYYTVFLTIHKFYVTYNFLLNPTQWEVSEQLCCLAAIQVMPQHIFTSHLHLVKSKTQKHFWSVTRLTFFPLMLHMLE